MDKEKDSLSPQEQASMRSQYLRSLGHLREWMRWWQSSSVLFYKDASPCLLKKTKAEVKATQREITRVLKELENL